MDTAGIRDTDDIVEKIGVERSRQALTEAELILYVLSNNEPLTSEDMELLDSVRDENVIVIINKLDLDSELDVAELENRYDFPIVKTSIREGKGVDDLEDRIAELFFGGQVSSADSTYLSNNRHISLLEQSNSAISDAIESAHMDVPIDIVQIDLVKTWELLGEVIGEDVSEQLIDQLFSQFCLGK